MRNLIRWATKLYPPAWRDRYGVEFDALLNEVGPSWRDLFNVLGGALSVRARSLIEGHVPVPAVKKLLEEKPDIRGISLPGMPEGSPGMSGTKAQPFQIYAIQDGGATPQVYAVE